MSEHRLRESVVERRVGRYVKSRKGLYLKLGQGGLPDRLILFPQGVILFLELKRPGAKPGKLQQFWLRKLRKYGFRAEYVDNYGSAVELVDEALSANKG